MPGGEREPAFSPDGNQVAFVLGGSENCGIYTTMVGGEKSLQLDQQLLVTTLRPGHQTDDGSRFTVISKMAMEWRSSGSRLRRQRA